jgi:glycosyltransferase involved in cell wall biosynthesis
MLSILIPTYNYNAFPLVEALYNQCLEAKIVFEIIVLDDASSHFLTENSKINHLGNCSFTKNEINLGRANNLNKLVVKSRFNWILLLDCDTFPKNENFIQNYLNEILKNNSVVFGGIAYKKDKPNQENLLRWKYGSKREEISVLYRNKNPYLTTLTSNILIKKSIFEDIKFNKEITKYGYEDLVFAQDLRLNKYLIKHIDNSVYHLNYETSDAFLCKTKLALKTLVFIEKHKILLLETKIQKTYNLINKFKLASLFCSIFKKKQSYLEQHLTSKKPSLFIFDLYRLGYYCKLKSK